MEEEQEALGALRGDWVHHDYTKKLLAEAREARRRKLARLIDFASKSKDPVVLAAWALYIESDLTVGFLTNGVLRRPSTKCGVGGDE
jgi:hypothetical protein